MKAKNRTICLASYLLLSIYIFAVAAYLEFLNYHAGGILPCKEYYNNDPQQGRVKWRYNPAALDLKALDVASQIYANDHESEQALPEPNAAASAPVAGIQPSSNESNTKNMAEILAQRENRLHSAVIKLGLPQYPLLALTGLILTAILLSNPASLTKKYLCLIAICCLLNILSFIALLERDYFGSLGW